MSAFLGPIHYWLYRKIEIQKDITDQIEQLLELRIPGSRLIIEEKYGKNAEGELEHQIDHSNIHGWLQNEITISEHHLAASVTMLLHKDQTLIEELKDIFYQRGQKTSEESQCKDAKEAYKILNDTLLDGMPCDHVNEIIEQDDESVRWRRTTDIHKKYWEEAQGDVGIYYELRELYINGLLKGTDLGYDRSEETYRIYKIA